MVYQIKIQNFEGPFDLLFHLIEKAEVSIYDIPIADITNQYLEYIYEMKSFDLEIASEFILMAATLIHIKSKMLLPKEPNPMDEISIDGEDPREELIEKLILYKKFKEASILLKENEEKCTDILYKNAEILDDIEEDKILINITLSDIVSAFKDIVTRYNENSPVTESFEQKILRDDFTVDEKIKDILQSLSINKKIFFQELFIKNVDKLELIVTFLALLELIHLKEVKIYQSKVYGDIIIEKG
jgi:segregation and condensation protein A